MNLKLILLLSALFILGCRNQYEETPPNIDSKSRITNDDLKNMLPHLLEIHRLTFESNPYFVLYKNEPTFVRFLTSERFVYAHISSLDCSLNPLYHFYEEIDSNSISVYVDSESIKPERYFDLSGLYKTQENGIMICDDWYFIVCKFQNHNGKLILEKISTFFDNSYGDSFFDQSDTAFLTEVKILIPEP